MAELEDKSRIRKRKDASKSKDGIKSSGGDDGGGPRPGKSAVEEKLENNVPPCQLMEAGSYWLTRIVFTRAIGFIYCTYMYDIMCDTSLDRTWVLFRGFKAASTSQ
jgi:hypothetical protein